MARLSLTREDWPLIKRASLILLAATGVAIVVLGATFQYSSVTSNNLLQAEARRQEANTKLANARTEQQDIIEYLARYQQLAATGMMREERRLDWIEQLERARAEFHLTDLSYELLAQQPLPVTALEPLTVTAGASRMRVNLGLLHEGELIDFLRALKARERGLFLVKRCRLERQPAGADKLNVNAECLLDWITLKHATEVSEAVDPNAAPAPLGKP